MAIRSHMGEGRRGRLRAVESLAGWVFADMLLVLFLVGIGTAIPHEPPKVITPPKVVKTHKPPQIVGMKTTPVKKAIRINAAGLSSGDKAAQRAACTALKRAFDKQIANQARAAFVLVFGGGTEPGPATDIAGRVYPGLRCASPRVFPAGTVRRTYWDGKLGRDDARVEVFFYTTRKGR